MHNESYEEYIRSILGYPNYTSDNSCCENDYNMVNSMAFQRNNETNSQLEACYPEIYKVVYPMVNKACSNNTKPITSKLVDELTDEIYAAVENDTEINININLTNEVSSVGNRNNSSRVKTENVKETPQNRSEDRQFRNRGLQDLIRILLIRELLGRPGGFPGHRPSFPPNRPPMRPPFPGGPGGGRPPIMPRSNYYEDMNHIYE